MTREMITHHGDYGRIINIATDASQVFAGQITYGANKATLEALTRSIALGWQSTALPSIVWHQALLRRDGLTPIWNSLFFQSFQWAN